jgi:hypothetical protein
MTRIALASIIALVVGLFVGGTSGWRVAERNTLRTGEALGASASMERVVHLLSVVEAIDTGAVDRARELSVRRMRAELASADDCAKKPECLSSVAEPAPEVKNALARASRLQ